MTCGARPGQRQFFQSQARKKLSALSLRRLRRQILRSDLIQYGDKLFAPEPVLLRLRL